MDQSQFAFLFIPDISGFTTFVNETEISHSLHIISELLEVIINSDELGLTVSEIEGDAILFYRESIPDLKDILDQCRKTFINFHNHVIRYDTERICRCGACEAAVNLSLKFIIHAGQIQLMNVKDHQKLHGADVILAHKFLKNSVPVNEYVLLSDKFDSSQIEEQISTISWAQKDEQSDRYEKLGKVNYSYIPLSDLHKEVKKPDQINFPGLSNQKVQIKTTIDASIDNIYERFTNFDKRVEWNEDIREIILQNEKINKSGAIHTCLVGSNSLDIQSIGRMEDEDKIVYGERLDKFKGLQDIITIYTFEKKEDKTRIVVDLDYRVGSFIGNFFKPLIRKMLIKQTKKGLSKLKLISEKS